MEAIPAPKLNLLTKAHENKWVAFSRDYKKILAIGETLSKLRDLLGKKDGVVMKVLPSDVGYAPTTR